MQDYISFVKQALSETIKEMSTAPWLFVKNPEHDFLRKRKLDFESFFNFFISMEGRSLGTELLDYFDFTPETPTASAFNQQRSKILPEAFEYLFHTFTDAVVQPKTWNNYRLLACDGSDLNIFRNPKDKDVILMADRGYESYNLFAHAQEKGWKFLIRAKDIHSNGILSGFGDFPDKSFDREVSFLLTRRQTNEIRSNPKKYKFMPTCQTFDYLPVGSKETYLMKFRVVRFLIGEDSYESIITNLSSEEFPPDVIKELYHMRWGIETSFRELKYAIGLTNFHAKKVEYIEQEIYARLTLYNFCEVITTCIVIKSCKKTKHCYQVNYTMAISICRQYLKCINSMAQNVVLLIRKYILPIRPGRQNPRKVKPQTAVGFLYRVV